ncbi:hypothetical protein [Desulfarculus baarsii]
MVYSQAAYCPCGQEIWLEYIRAQGEGGWRCRFFDEQNQEISVCPACGRPLNEEELASR